MKRTTITCLFILIVTFSFAQKITLSGIVNDNQGKPVAFAFVKDAQHNYATFTDTYGAFNLKVDSADRLIVSALNFKGTTVTIKDPQNVSVVLTATDAKSIKPAFSGDSFKEKISTEGMTKNAATGYIAQENSVHGSRYLFDSWVHGYVVTTADSIKQNDGYMFNYQKMDGSLVFTDDGVAMKEIDRSLTKRFTLFDDGGQSYLFENLPAIDPKHFVLVLASGSKYRIYKQLGTKFIANNYVSNGMTSSGNNYDEFKDEPVYYVAKMPEGTLQKFALKRKAIKTAFAGEPDKVNKYMAAHDEDDIDDAYLKNLGEAVNN